MSTSDSYTLIAALVLIAVTLLAVLLLVYIEVRDWGSPRRETPTSTQPRRPLF